MIRINAYFCTTANCWKATAQKIFCCHALIFGAGYGMVGLADKGKPAERRGRKATGLIRGGNASGRVAGLPTQQDAGAP